MDRHHKSASFENKKETNKKYNYCIARNKKENHISNTNTSPFFRLPYLHRRRRLGIRRRLPVDRAHAIQLCLDLRRAAAAQLLGGHVERRGGLGL
jgi:hypothetical protein